VRIVQLWLHALFLSHLTRPQQQAHDHAGNDAGPETN
jgi:hypothetical protein